MTLSALAYPDQNPSFAIELVCPLCQRNLFFASTGKATCVHCRVDFPSSNGTWDFTMGTTFDDGAIDESQKCYEGCANADTVHNFWLPVLRNLLAGIPAPRVLSVGCGVGMDVDVLCDAGIECFGIDCGHRGSSWQQRRFRDHLLLANGMYLPFASNTFDAVFCGCVFPHVGTVGDTNIPDFNAQEQRSQLAREMVRILRPGGHIIASSPNRWFPADLFHGRENGGYKPRFNSPTSRFLLSAGDYQQLFAQAGCSHLRPLPVRRYWGFIRSAKSWKGRLLALPVRALFALADLPFLRTWPLNPWLVVSLRKLPS